MPKFVLGPRSVEPWFRRKYRRPPVVAWRSFTEDGCDAGTRSWCLRGWVAPGACVRDAGFVVQGFGRWGSPPGLWKWPIWHDAEEDSFRFEISPSVPNLDKWRLSTDSNSSLISPFRHKKLSWWHTNIHSHSSAIRLMPLLTSTPLAAATGLSTRGVMLLNFTVPVRETRLACTDISR